MGMCEFEILKDKLAKNAFVVPKDMNKSCVEQLSNIVYS